MAHKLLFTLLSFMVFSFSNAQNNWVLKADKDGIKVYTGTMPNSKVKAIKVVSTLHTTLNQLAVAILDINTAKQWVYSTKSCTLLKQVSPTELYYYSEVNVPWPVSNRDFVAHLTLHQDAATKVMTVDAENAPTYLPAKPNIVRIPQSIGKWVATPTGINDVKIEYTLFADPGGSVPSWLINMFITKGPLESFKKLKDLLDNQAFNNTQVAFVKN
jgi:hypothetical protein